MRICAPDGSKKAKRGELLTIDQIVATRDPELRAHRVACTYADVAARLAALVENCEDDTSDDACRPPGPSQAMGCGHRSSANWFHFATWATSTLVTNISNGQAPRRVGTLGGLRRAATPAIVRARAAGDQYVGRWLAYGQLVVFQSTVPPAFHLLRQLKEQRKKPCAEPRPFCYSEDQWRCTWSRAGDPEDSPSRRAFQRSLSTAFDAYLAAQWHTLQADLVMKELRQAQADASSAAVRTAQLEHALIDSARAERLDQRRAEFDCSAEPGTAPIYNPALTDADTRKTWKTEAKSLGAEADRCAGVVGSYQQRLTDHRLMAARHILLANILITTVEQARVDETVTEVLDFWPEMTIDKAENRAAHLIERYRGIPGPLAAIGLASYTSSARRLAVDTWARLLTDQVLVLAVPGETLRLGRDLRPLVPGQAFIPTGMRLDEIEESTDETPEFDRAPMELLINLIDTLDRSAGDGIGSAANDWRLFADRMNWAVNFLRSRQFAPSLRWPPYRDEDVERIKAGKLPLRGGDPTGLEIPAPFGRPATRSRP